ncbi:uncharacterized protein LOC112346795 isoform X2 [Selaginella moellendorffii]|uniref:uncharacterized protein LOC112346795 isoform X2 n=1 Tax=Selaginella moellendorffii TaxID=88036 RepID=UPI000D1C2FED|nr:uncharacterized protein LOC112346795 isoform X2 [Selaginella moellendorffii]|eukprot:XP_024532228.1 uncharacterized protein LOC112346795 isoform X2 [Selaginella moellendorffii]
MCYIVCPIRAYVSGCEVYSVGYSTAPPMAIALMNVCPGKFPGRRNEGSLDSEKNVSSLELVGRQPWPWKRTVLGALVVGFACVGIKSQHHGLALATTTSCESESYYEGTQALTGTALELKLHHIVQEGHDSISYVQVWEALKFLDEDPSSPDDIQRSAPKELAGKIDGWNREHLWPRSYGLKQGQPEFTDLHNLRPADTNVNSSRRNKYFGDCTVESVGDCLVPANREAGADTATDKKSWRPPKEVRGDIARSVMYMAVRYFPSLRLSNTPSIANAEMGVLSMLLRWNDADPPSPSEEIRNSKICQRYQHNRNPFVDHPEFAHRIW